MTFRWVIYDGIATAFIPVNSKTTFEHVAAIVVPDNDGRYYISFGHIYREIGIQTGFDTIEDGIRGVEESILVYSLKQ